MRRAILLIGSHPLSSREWVALRSNRLHANTGHQSASKPQAAQTVSNLNSNRRNLDNNTVPCGLLSYSHSCIEKESHPYPSQAGEPKSTLPWGGTRVETAPIPPSRPDGARSDSTRGMLPAQPVCVAGTPAGRTDGSRIDCTRGGRRLSCGVTLYARGVRAAPRMKKSRCPPQWSCRS